MKKVIFVLAIAFGFAACGSGESTEPVNTDSTAVDSVKVDSVKVDSAAKK
jgi:ABC-type glycerol-3-phosphate transport system substrate-binding protein